MDMAALQSIKPWSYRGMKSGLLDNKRRRIWRIASKVVFGYLAFSLNNSETSKGSESIGLTEKYFLHLASRIL